MADVLRKLLQDRNKLLAMSTAARGLYRADATDKVIESCFKVAKKSKEQPKPNQEQEKADQYDKLKHGKC